MLYAIGKTLRWFGDYYAVTSQRQVLIKGFLTRDVISIPNFYVASMRFRRSFMGRVLGYGQFIIEADRTLPVWMINYLPFPEPVP